MRIKALRSFASIPLCMTAGDEKELSEKEALSFIRAGLAEEIPEVTADENKRADGRGRKKSSEN